MDKAFAKSIAEVTKELEGSLDSGLTSDEAQIRLKKYGKNILKEVKSKNALIIFLSQFKSILITILIGASIIAFFLGDLIDGGMILAIVFLNSFIGFIQEYRVEKTIAHLKKLITLKSFVYRDGKLLQIPSIELVPGDLVSLEEGQKVAADIRLASVINLQVVEATLTGESTPIPKITQSLKDNLPLADQTNMVFSGTTISAGKGIGIVVATGMSSQIGKISSLVSGMKEPTSPMKEKLEKLGRQIGHIVIIVAALIFLQQFLLGHPLFDALLSSVALTVSAIPEGLPAVVTISLAFGIRRLARHNGLVRNLPAAETLGSTDVICTDKTGTLTKGEMEVRKIFGNEEDVLKIGVLVSNASLNGRGVIGEATEVALIKKAIDKGLDPIDLIKQFPRVQELPFTSERKMMTTVNKSGESYLIASKGSVEAILNLCTKVEKAGKVEYLTEERRKEILKENEKFASSALRVLAFAKKEISSLNEKEIEKDLVFIGLQGLMDPPREGVKEAIQTCKKAGIKVVMITGDHLLTAKALSKELGLGQESITGEELDKLSDVQFLEIVEKIDIYARVNPGHKIKIIKALRKKDHQVCMTGDGVNDAPALKVSDIGVAMGITGTDVAKDSSDMILLDDNFTTIVAAVREGRGIYENIRKFVNYLLTSNMMEVSVIFFALTLGWSLPLLPLHLLWINLVTDGLPAIALGVDPTRREIMHSPPNRFRENIIGKRFFKSLLIVVTLSTIVILSIFYFYKESVVYAQTMAFTGIVLFELIRIFVIRSNYNLSFFSNKFLIFSLVLSFILQLIILYLPINIFGLTLQQLFRIQPLALIDWIILIFSGIILFVSLKLLIKSSFQTDRNYSKLT